MNIEVLVPEKKDAKWGFSGTLLWGLLIAALFLGVQVIVLSVYIGVNYMHVAADEYNRLLQELENNGNVISFSTFATCILCGSMILSVIKLKKGSSLKSYLGWYSVDFKTASNWLAGMALLIILSDLLPVMLGQPVVPEVLSYAYSTAYSPVLLWLALIIAAPLFEELFFRGFLLPGFASSVIGPVGAVIVTAALWAILHLQYDLPGIVTIFAMGLLLGAARLMSGSILLTIGLHAFSNLVSMIETMIKVS
jgi:membrane protease YdiL (CAAX protease family)